MQKTDLKYRNEIEIEIQFRFVRQNVQNITCKIQHAKLIVRGRKI